MLENRWNMLSSPKLWINQPAISRTRILPKRVFTRSYTKASRESVTASRIRVPMIMTPMMAVEMPKPMLAA